MTSPASTIAPPALLLAWLLRIPLFYKILIANAGIVLVGTVVGTVLTRAFIRGGTAFPVGWVVALASSGVLVTILVNALILRLALTPLKLLEETAGRVQGGDLDARVPYSPLRDRQLERLTRTFNAMLDNLESYRQRLSGIAARAMNAEEEERKRIARELHDDTAQALASLLIRLRLLRAVEDPAARDPALDEMRAEVGDALERIRRFARGLRPPALDDLGLVPALESHVRALSESIGVTTRVEAEPLEGTLTRQAELALYRIAQEATSNAVRHGNPGRVTIRLRKQRDAVELQVEDDGGGFDVDRVLQTDEGGLGLFGMQERAAYVGGNLSIVSEPGEGTRVLARIPLSVAGLR
ncbi:MAG TPA: ATP-binding protein [Longimicrobiaceae bacterium]|nr:ATP-binding protein [Longimicrobiaceae bacterium]